MFKRAFLVAAVSLLSITTATAANSTQPTATDCGPCGQTQNQSQSQTRNVVMAQNVFQQAPVRARATAVGDIGIPPRDEGNQRICCPPLASQPMTSFFRVHQQPGENVTQTYGLEFMPTAGMDTQMQAFAPFAALMLTTPGRTANSILLVGDMRATTAPTGAAYNAAGTGGSVSSGFHALRGWWASGVGTWDGTGPALFRNSFKDQPTPGSFLNPAHMVPNQWYVVRLKFQLAEKDPNPQSWYQKDFDCTDATPRYVAIRINALQGFRTGGGAAPTAVEIVEVQ
jgi:hypothetical protein